MNYAATALEKYQEEHGEDPELRRIETELKERYDYEGDAEGQSLSEIE
jgi:hypothetical protein